VVLAQHDEVAEAHDGFGAPVRELVEGCQLLHDQSRLTQDHVRHVGAEADAVGLFGGSREQKPHILVVRLVHAIARIETKIVGQLDHIDGVS
jgi:hypothetical protein